MKTMGNILDEAQERLHDDEALWSRAELLRYANDGYDQFLSKSRCVRRFAFIDVPPRYAYTYTHEWESDFTEQGPSRKMTWASLDGRVACTNQWEAEQLENVAPTNSNYGHTQDWERSQMTVSDHHFQFVLPHQNDLILRVQWDQKLLSPLAVRELDHLDTPWFRQVGMPYWWTTGMGRIKTFEVYEIRTDYNQQYSHKDYDRQGLARGWSGYRTYEVVSDVNNAFGYSSGGDGHVLRTTRPALIAGLGWRFTQYRSTAGVYCTQPWEAELLNGQTSGFTAGGRVGTYRFEWRSGWATFNEPEFGVGTPRSMSSPDRQYWPSLSGAATNLALGGIRGVESDVESVSVYHVVLPDVVLDEDDAPDLLPEQASKYLRYFVLHRAFARSGEGQNYPLSGHYMARFNRGCEVWKKLADLAFKDHVFTRENTDEVDRSRVPCVKLPANFPAVWP